MFGGGFAVARTDQAGVETDTGRAATFDASTVPLERLDVGHSAGADVLAGLVYEVAITTRERKV